MPRPERPVDPEGGALARFAIGLRELRREAGNPGYRELARRVHYATATLSQAAGGEALPSLAVTLAYVRGCGGDVAVWERRWRATAEELETDPPPEPVEDLDCAPYVGLAAYGPDDAAWFHGREKIVDELVARVGAHRLVTVFGPSGTGKTSVLRAGLLPRLTAQGSVLAAVFTPGAHPLEECAVQLTKFLDHGPGVAVAELAADSRGLHRLVKQALVDRPPGTEIALLIDQFEEIFTLCQDADERARFVAALVVASRRSGSRCRIVLSVRADFYAHCLSDTDLAAALNGGQLAVGPMTVDELRQVVVGPARRAGCMVEGALLATLVALAHGRVGALPLLSHALLESWRRRSGNTLTLAGFERAGGIDGALTKTAEAVFASLTERQQAATRELFLRLVTLGEGAPDSKRRVGREELDDDYATILTAFSDARLVVLSEHGAEITHEALIGAWPRLCSWLADDREGQRTHRKLTEATATWQEHDRDPGTLLRGTRLAVVTDWARQHPGAANTAEAAFLDASTAEEERERAAVRRRARVLRGLVALLALLLAVAITMGIHAVRVQESADQQSNAAIALNAIRDAESLMSTDPVLAAQISMAAHRLYPSRPTENSLIAHAAAVTAEPLPTDGLNIALAPDGQVIANARPDTDVTSLSENNGPVSPLPGGRFPSRFSPDGSLLLTVDQGGVPRLWDVTTPVPTLRSVMGTTALEATFSPAGDLLVTTDATLSVSDPAQGFPATLTPGSATRLWSITDDHPKLLATLPDTAAVVTEFADRRRIMATVSHGDPAARVTLWNLIDPTRPAPIGDITLPPGIQPLSAEFTHDDRILYVGDSAGQISAWDVGQPGEPRKVGAVNRNRSPVSELVASPDGRTLVSVDATGGLVVWDISVSHTPREPMQMTDHVAGLTGITFTDDKTLLGVVLATAPEKPSLVRWHLDTTSAEQALCGQNPERLTEKEWRRHLAGAAYQPPCL